MNRIALLSLAALAGCTQAQLSKFATDANKVVVAGQLFCAKATADGPLVVALANASGIPVIVTGASSAAVAAACAVIDAVPVSPPANPAAAPVVSAPVTTLPTAPTS